MNRRLLIGIFIALILAALFFILKPTSQQPTKEQIQKRLSVPIPTKINKITLSANGFDPRTITIAKGETVSWLNSSGRDATVNSDPYPKNNLHKFLNLGEFRTGSTVQAIFDTAGEYKYHNHLIPTQTGTIIVK